MLNNTWGNNLVGNRITNQSDSIYLWNSFNNTIASNIISDNGLGIGFDSSNSNNVLGNNITGNFYGITLLSSPNNTLRSNVLDNNSYGLEVSWFLYLDNQLSYFIQDIDSSNTMNGQPICYLVNHNNEQVPLDVGFVALVNCTNITVRDLNLKNNVQGMILACTNNSRIQNLNITNNRHGIYLFRSYNNVICDSNLSHNSEIGISLESSSENNIVRNNVTRSPEGIFLSDSSSNNITNNYIANNKYRGVVVALSSENNIAYNNVTGNGMAGIGIYSDGKGTLEKNLVQGNNLINNTCGVQLGDTSGNRCYHNNFVNNTEQASVTVSIGSVSYGNVWDNGYPSGGNYWSDYTGIDLFSGPLQNETGADGIGDSWYDRDHYPLMGMFSDFNATQECHVQTICNSAISSFQFNGTAIRFNVSGESGTIGFCRICIPTALMNSPYKVYVNGTQVSYSLLQCSNETYSYLYFNYTHSTQEVIIIPEFPSLFILPIFMTATLLAVIVYKRKQA
jgi:parallel beta-helix repeat protein